MTSMTSTHTLSPPGTGLALSTGGITAARNMLEAFALQRTDLDMMEPYIRRHNPDRYGEFLQHRFGVDYVNHVEKLWRTQGRQVLSMHPGLTEEVRLARSTKIAPEVFRTLPYINPMVVFPEPIEVPSWNDHPERIRVQGFIAHGRRSSPEAAARAADDRDFSGMLGSTHDPDLELLGLVIVTEVIDRQTGQIKNHEFNRTSIPLNRGARTLKETVETAVGQYGWANTLGSDIASRLQGEDTRRDTSNNDRQRAFMTGMYSLVLGSMMYLCSTVLDAERVPKSRVQRAWGQNTRQVPNLVNVGWRIGPGLSTARKAYLDKESVSGRTLPPHQRCAHFKTVWTGPGRSVPKTVFIAPYWVHKEQMHLVDTKTVRAVK